MKNPTLREIALLASGLTAGLALVILLLIHQAQPENIKLWVVFTVSIAVFGFNFWLVYTGVERFVYRKIKPIYKTIHTSKSSSDKLKDQIAESENILDEVEREVQEYATAKTREIEALKQTERFRREFLGNVSHELKTPLYNAQGYLETLINGGIQDEKVASDFVYKAHSNLDRLGQIVDDLLLINQYESGQLQLKPQQFAIRDLIREVVESFEMQADNRDMKVGFKSSMENTNFMVEADRQMIYQVLINLVSNSLKYGEEGNEVLIGYYDMHEYILVEVTDDGSGIAEEHIPRLFERFYRIDKHRSRDEGGTGLGLSIVKHIIEAHKQTINVRSTPGQGSTFGFTLKKAESRRAEKTA